VEIDLGNKNVDVYDTVGRTFLGRNTHGTFRFSVAADAARVLVLVPAGKKYQYKNGLLQAGGVVVDFKS
jgi:hypothetical protein